MIKTNKELEAEVKKLTYLNQKQERQKEALASYVTTLENEIKSLTPVDTPAPIYRQATKVEILENGFTYKHVDMIAARSAVHYEILQVLFNPAITKIKELPDGKSFTVKIVVE